MSKLNGFIHTTDTDPETKKEATKKELLAKRIISTSKAYVQCMGKLAKQAEPRVRMNKRKPKNKKTKVM
ncbi:hypothetical protein A2914_02525 [Candidatus Nomurabacteria bacterium RIFCSPLOWO2_01_FULL_41_21]|uniref:Uncharacterized protein n=2 Tax=Candidatus Nomuraibacteriota TaxID=1752729 RepID=A0A1F6V307_9BACT|nr:MAG: hypothetical protein A2733_02540 [Candidatus Nomurabacteria bacterium RIFCSPHIGHO2_01_FULL_40_20]OGI88840.1 MAG: hypothetical protein A2914_02525 [Candidatus Nomurabacteria bacterium RIFCSPLOWO2_01_FULL_41_21]